MADHFWLVDAQPDELRQGHIRVEFPRPVSMPRGLTAGRRLRPVALQSNDDPVDSLTPFISLPKAKPLTKWATRSPLAHLRHIIDESERILDLPNDWDDAGSPAVSREAWNLAEAMLIESARKLDEPRAHWFADPYISPGPGGSVDIVWRTDERYLLLNIRTTDGKAEAGFYGDDGHGNYAIEGTFDPSRDGQWIAQWLIG